jgi:sulfate adenylyltransferase large subunit
MPDAGRGISDVRCAAPLSRGPVSVPATAAASPAPHPAGAVQLLRLLTCGSVDDGKSTLIGRQLYDCRAVFADQVAAIEKASRRRGEEKIDLSLFTDGLRWEREQGITIDVAYRYFSTANRRFILIDSPGHAQYTRNMVTGASNADAAVILVDVRYGVQEQTHRHACIAALLGIRTLIVAVNKMDAVEWSAAAFESCRNAFEKLRPELAGAEVIYVPVSALCGDNIVHRSTHMPWYTGPALLELLETAPIHALDRAWPGRFPVQLVIRPRRGAPDPDFRGYAGSVASGSFRIGDRVVAASTGRASTIVSIHLHDQRLEECRAPQSVVLTLADDIDVGRGEMLTRADEAPDSTRDLRATLVWMSEHPLQVGRRYLLRHTTHFTPAVVSTIHTRLDIHSLEHRPHTDASTLQTNDIGRVTIRTAAPLQVDPYSRCRATGSLVLIDEAAGDTVGAAMVLGDDEGRQP